MGWPSYDVFGLVKNGHCIRDQANRNWADPLGPGPAQRSGPASPVAVGPVVKRPCKCKFTFICW